MHLRKLPIVAASLCLALGAMAQTGAPAPSQPDVTAKTPASPSSTSTKKSRKSSKSAKSSKSKTRSARKSRKKKSAPQATVVKTAPDLQAGVVDDGEAPQISHQGAAPGVRGKPLALTAHASDANGVFGPVLYFRKKGMGANDYVPIKMVPSKIVPGDYAVEVPAALTNVEAVEYYFEAWDMAGNGPARVGSAEAPLSVAVEEEKKIVAPTAPTNVTIKPRGNPPAITHAAVTQALKGKPVEINARLVGDSGVQGATVLFRHAGENDYKALPMGNIGGNDFTATTPASMATSDIEYYVEAFDKNGNGPARSGAPNVPYAMKLTDPAAVAAAQVPPPSASRKVLEEESEHSDTIIGLGVDGGAPGGGGLALLVRPLRGLPLTP